MKISETLDAAADLILQPGKWTRGTYARDKLGHGAFATSEKATCFCALGAVMHLDGVTNVYSSPAAKYALEGVCLPEDITLINDDANGPDAPAAALRALAERARKAGL